MFFSATCLCNVVKGMSGWLFSSEPVRPRERSDPPGHGCSPECCVGPVGEGRGQGGDCFEVLWEKQNFLHKHDSWAIVIIFLQPLWKLLVDMVSHRKFRSFFLLFMSRMWLECVLCVSIQDPKQIVSCIDFRYITDALTEEEALGETGLWCAVYRYVQHSLNAV